MTASRKKTNQSVLYVLRGIYMTSLDEVVTVACDYLVLEVYISYELVFLSLTTLCVEKLTHCYEECIK